jgi:O-antigen biosynthesis protein
MNTKPSTSISELVFGELQALQHAPKHLSEITSWHGHIPFAFWLVKKLEPSVFVELGVQKGDSYSAFCQAVQLFSLNTACYGVDAWKGDDQAALYEETIYQKYSSYHDEQYASFSSLIRTTFDDALGYFADSSVDLLHINGGHDYDDVKHNFEFWLPKLSAQAVVLFHDINARERELGVWKLFHELSQQYVGRTFSFLHSHGLGVLIVGDNVPEILQRLCHLKDEDATYVRLAFSTFGKFVKAQAIESTLRSKLEELDSTNKQMVTERRKTEIESHKYEIQLASALQERDRQMEECHRQIEEAHSALQERDRQIEEAHHVNEILMRSLSMRLTKPLRALNNLVRRLRQIVALAICK